MRYGDVDSLLNGWGMVSDVDRSNEMIVLYLGSLLFYTLSAAALTAYLVNNFDDAIDRPRTHGGVERGPRGKPFSLETGETPDAL